VELHCPFTLFYEIYFSYSLEVVFIAQSVIAVKDPRHPSAAYIFIVLVLYIADGHFYFRQRDGFIDTKSGVPRRCLYGIIIAFPQKWLIRTVIWA